MSDELWTALRDAAAKLLVAEQARAQAEAERDELDQLRRALVVERDNLRYLVRYLVRESEYIDWRARRLPEADWMWGLEKVWVTASDAPEYARGLWCD